ncbi:MAG TPA: M13 family metallopeptidase N-terminal domain-containing protein, partial [Verrucomicrobiae bacterium]|nr:M13 family metallopeptidase N-terminal domain-containing protein [Verrucomicrobiae bacterium]
MTTIAKFELGLLLAAAVCFTGRAEDSTSTNQPPRVPAFSVDYMDRSVNPSVDFYHYADGTWLKSNPVPADKSRWASFMELSEHNWYLIHGILDEASKKSASLPAHSPEREVGDFYASAMDTNRIEALGLKPLADDLEKIDRIKSTKDLIALQADFHQRGIGGMFSAGFGPDSKNSSIYAVQLEQGGISLPDRDYYVKETLADKLSKYHDHVVKMFTLFGDTPAQAATNADIVVAMETALAKASRTRVERRDPEKNYNKYTSAELAAKTPALLWSVYFTDRNLADPGYEVVGQPEFFDEVNRLVQERPLSDWKIYLRWHLLHGSAPCLSSAFQEENFNFFGKV